MADRRQRFSRPCGLVGLDPRIVFQSGLAGHQFRTERERLVLRRRDRHDANVERVYVEAIAGDNQGREFFVQVDQADFGSPCIPSWRLGTAFRRHHSRAQVLRLAF